MCLHLHEETSEGYKVAAVVKVGVKQIEWIKER